ncbi:MAG: 50S ribosomal protein L18 [Gallionellales bacterium RIFCSPLOWO2_12_FULL_57_18]|jgi:large subunit ribosomal protein L18|nr:50S ribosomal protein L18 [Gallionella sp.]OGS94450.1 MAG: 50S ribosomal protein L18 [Gallionellales bacterium RIFCSPLOWO2_12_FULL_57_18]OGS96779.1 MAG: 50S ribosomal protein L18 [Gallionellales bacterium RIFCSPLOWO2_02_FULL_57_47]OGT17641.1 MAG: 50S ribosomal protein L18 [Gallionellales bacterium RIFCSPHIGHO2_02_FULL_57_16]
MLIKKEARLRRSRKTRARIAEKKTVRLAIHRTNLHIYAQVLSACGTKVLASASSIEAEVRKDLANGGNKAAAAVVGKRIAEKAKSAGISQVAFDRSGNRYHGRVKALAEAAREHGLQF